MRGHSHGEWYGSLDDVLEPGEDAEYWAVFGITHRGNKHCLGEFPTQAAAKATTRDFITIPTAKRFRKAFRSGGRKIVQLEIVPNVEEDAMVEVIALCSDGTVWQRGIGRGQNTGLVDGSWVQISQDGIDSD